MKKLLILLFLFPILAFGQSRTFDTVKVKKGVSFDSLGAPSPSAFGKGYLMGRGSAGLFYVTGNSVSRLDSGYSGGGGGTGITNLSGLTASTQYFVNDYNLRMTSIAAPNAYHILTWFGLLSEARGGTGVSSLSTLSGTSNQITVTGGGKVIGGNTVLSLPQSIDTTSSVRFNRVSISNGGAFQFGNYSGGAGVWFYTNGTPAAQYSIAVPLATGTMAVTGVSPLSVSGAGQVFLSGIAGYQSNQILGSNSVGNSLEYKAFSNGTNISVVNTPNLITIGLSGTVAVSNGGTGLSSLPSANRILASNTGGSAYVGKVLVGAGAATVTNSNDTITISTDASVGEANSIGLLNGTGVSIFKNKVGADIYLKKIKGMSPITATDGNDSVMISADTTILATQSDLQDFGRDTLSVSGDSAWVTIPYMTTDGFVEVQWDDSTHSYLGVLTAVSKTHGFVVYSNADEVVSGMKFKYHIWKRN